MDTIDVSSKFVVSDITTPKNTNALNTLVATGGRILKSVDILFAPGHVGLTGVRITYGGVPILPWNQAAGFIIGDSERLHYELNVYTPGTLTIITHNGDATFAHRHIVTLELQEVRQVADLSAVTALPSLVV